MGAIAAIRSWWDDRRYYRSYQRQWGPGPFLTADVALIHNGCIALVVRGRAPGRGQLALPGGFLEKGETFYEAAMREAEEEIGLDLSHDVHDEPFIADNPRRSQRGRVVSVVYPFMLGPGSPRPTLTPGDDAEQAAWFNIDDLQPADLFEDYFEIIDEILARF